MRRGCIAGEKVTKSCCKVQGKDRHEGQKQNGHPGHADKFYNIAENANTAITKNTAKKEAFPKEQAK